MRTDVEFSAGVLPAEMVVPHRFDLDSTIRETVEEHGYEDPGEVAERVVDLIPDHALRAIVRDLLPPRVRRMYQVSRRNNGRDTGFRLKSDRSGSRPDDGKWKAVADLSRNPKGWPVWVNGDWQALGQCTAEDLQDAVDHYLKRAKDVALRPVLR